MTKLILNICVTIFLFLMYSSCDKYERIPGPNLLYIETLLQSQPDSALFLLEKMYPPEKITHYNRAYYYLLLTEARSKNNESLLSSDSLMDWTIDYLDDKKDKNLKAKAWIYKGKIWADLKEPEKALSSYQKAWNLLDKNNPILFEINNDVGNIYSEKGLYEDALNVFQNNYLLGIQKSDKKNLALSLRNIGYTYFYLNNSDSAYHYIQEALKYAGKSDDSTHLTNLIHTDLALFYEGKGEYEKGIQELQKVKENNPSIYFNKGSLFMELQQYDSARYYLLLSSDCDYIYTQAASYACLSDLETIRGNHEKSNFYLKKYDELHDSIDNDSRMAEIKTITHKYNIQTAVAQLKTKQRIKIGIILAFSVFLLLVTIGIFIIGDKKKKIKHQVQEKKILDLQSQILLTQNTILKRQQVQPEVNNQKDPDQKELNILQNQIDDLQCKMFRMKPIYATIQQLVKQERTPKEEKKILKFQDRQILKEEIYICFSEFINKLKEACPSIKEEDIELCCLSKLGLPLTVICLCFGVQETDSIRQRKYQLKKRMREHKCLELFYSAFEHKNDHK